MANFRNVRKTRNNFKNEYSITKISVAVTIVIIVILLIIFGIIKIKNKFLDKKISYNQIEKYEYFILYDLNNKAGVIDKNGDNIIETEYREIYIPNEEKDVFFCYDENDDLTILNERSEEIFLEYDEVSFLRTSDTTITDFEENVLKYKENDKYGLIDLDGYKVTEAIYQSISSLKNKPGAILVKKNDKYCFSDGLFMLI